MKILIGLMLVSILNSGCLSAALIAAGTSIEAQKAETRAGKERFMAQYNEMNIEREKEGLPPLDLCTEKYHFDKKWADDDAICEERIERYEAGDTNALGSPEMEIIEYEHVGIEQPEYNKMSEGERQPFTP